MIKRKNLFLFTVFLLVFFINIPPAYLLLNDSISFVFEILQMIIFTILVILFAAYSKRNGISLIVVLIVMFFGVYILSTYIHKGNVSAAIKPLLNTFSLCSLFIINKKNVQLFIRAGLLYLEFVIFINLFTIFLFPSGLYKVQGNINNHYFLGHRNNSIEYLIPAICFSCINDYMNGKKLSKNNIVLVCASFLTVFFTWSANAILVMALLILTLYLPTKKILQKVITCGNFFILYVIFFVSIVIYRLQYYFSWLIVDILHRSLDFTYRTYIWDKSLYWIKKSLFIGYGYESPTLKALKIGHSNSCHNYVLDFMYMGGIIIVVVLLIVLFVVFKRLKNSTKYVSSILTSVICSYFILWFATPIHKDVLCIMFLIFTMAYYIYYFDKREVQSKNEKIC